MAKRLQIDNTPAQVKEFVKQLEVDKGEYVLEENGKPLIGIVPPWQVGKLAQKREEILALLEKSWQRNRTVGEEEIDHAVTEAIDQTRLQIHQMAQMRSPDGARAKSEDPGLRFTSSRLRPSLLNFQHCSSSLNHQFELGRLLLMSYPKNSQ